MDYLLSEIRDSFGRVVYTHKIHEKEREIQSGLSTFSKWVNILLGAVTLGGLLAALTETFPWALWVGVVVGILNVGYMLAQLSFDPQRRAGLHRAAAKQLLSVRDGYQTLIADVMAGVLDEETARRRRDELDIVAQEAYRLAPDTGRLAYRWAMRGLKVKQDKTLSNEEVDAFLPEGLRAGSVSPNA